MRRSLGYLAELATEHRGPISEVSTRGYDQSTDLTGVGGGPGVAALSRAGLFVPDLATPDQLSRYLFLLCGINIPECVCLYVKGLRQAVLLRAVATLSHSIGIGNVVDDLIVEEREIESPFWTFPDGNVSWHLRFVPGNGKGPWPSRGDLQQIPSASPELRSLTPEILYLPPNVSYRPLNNGSPPGNPVGDYGTFYDLRFPWQSNDFQLALPVRGPGRLMFFASVKQSCPTTRPNPNDLPGLRIEDSFVSQFPQSAVYGRVAGSIIFEVRTIPAHVQRRAS